MTGAWLAAWRGVAGRWLTPLLVLAGSSAAVRPGHLTWSLAATATTASLWAAGKRLRQMERSCRRSEQVRRELMAYLLLDAAGTGLRDRAFAKTVCGAVVARSPFRGAALLLRDEDGRLQVVECAGMDDLSVQALERWSAAEALPAGTERAGEHGFRVMLERRRGGQDDVMTRLGCEEVVVLPMQTGEPMSGMLVVSMRLHRGVDGCRAGGEMSREELGEALLPLEALTLRLTLQEAERAKQRGRPRWRETGSEAAPQDTEGQAPTRGRRMLDREEAGPAERPGVSLWSRLETSVPQGYVLPLRAHNRAQGYFRTQM